jgi:hypothetical protein
MRIIRTMGAVFVVVTALSAVTTSAALAEEFIASKTGKLNGKALNTQKFRTGGGATIECTEAAVEGEVTKLKGTEQAWSIKSSKSCTWLGIGKAESTLGDYTLFVPKELSLLMVNRDYLVAALGLKCHDLVTAGQTRGKGGGELEYVNKSGKLEVRNKITNIENEVTESSSESLCGKVGEKKLGTYEGSYEVELEGGTIEVK